MDFRSLYREKRIKNINLRIRQTGEVQISAPIKTSLDTIHHFLHQKRSWIESHRYRLLQQQEQEVARQLISGEFVYFQGLKYELQLFESPNHQRIELRGNQIHIFVRPNASQANKELLLKKWYRQQMESILPPLLDKWQSKMGLSIHQISIKTMKSRWGSCHPIKKHITLNLRLIEKPLVCLEYVVVHELVHLFEASHNQRFHSLMTHYLPHWKQIKKQLN